MSAYTIGVPVLTGIDYGATGDSLSVSVFLDDVVFINDFPGPDRIPRYRVATVNFLITDLAQASDNPLRCYTGRPDIHRHCRATLPSPESVWWIDSQARSPKRATLGPE